MPYSDILAIAVWAPVMGDWFKRPPTSWESLGTGVPGSRTVSQSRQVSVGTESLITILYSLVYLLILLYLLNWFYQAVKRVEKSLQEIAKRLEAIEAGPNRPAGSSPNVTAMSTPPQPTKQRERISNMWGIPAILFIIALFTESLGLTQYLLYAAAVMLVVAAAWEVIRREM